MSGIAMEKKTGGKVDIIHSSVSIVCGRGNGSGGKEKGRRER
jgi:hypothetical protein